MQTGRFGLVQSPQVSLVYGFVWFDLGSSNLKGMTQIRVKDYGLDPRGLVRSGIVRSNFFLFIIVYKTNYLSFQFDPIFLK